MSTKLAYLAGIVDGEGTITLSARNRRTFRRIEVSVSNTNKGLVDWLKAEFGGAIRVRRGRKAHYKVLYEWRITDDRALRLLRCIRKYLRIKKPRADLICANWPVAPRKGAYTIAEIAARQVLELAVLSL